MENIIKIHLKEKQDYKNTYNDQILSYDLSNYILEESKNINTKQHIKFVITSDFKISEKEKEDLVDMIRKNFGTDIGEIINLSKKEKLINLLIFFTGIIFLLLYYIIALEVLSEFTLILGWVFLGEAICNFLYNGLENKLKITRRKQIINAKVVFK